MSNSSQHDLPRKRLASAPSGDPSLVERTSGQQVNRWGGIAGVTGGLLLFVSAAVVGALGLPDASDVETLTDYADIESGRIAEHFLYLGALILFALQTLVLYRLLSVANLAAALFGAAVAEIGLVIMAASSLLHVSTSPLHDLYSSPDTRSEDLASIEYAWHGAQSVFDTMLTTGVLLVPIGIVLFGVAMRSTQAFGSRLTWLAIALGVVGLIGAVIAVVVPGSAFSAAAVAAIVVFYISTGWRTLKIGTEVGIDVTDSEPTSIH